MIEADDLALLATGFTAAMRAAPGAAVADAALFELGWADVLAAAPMQGLSVVFAALGSTGSAACLLDDVVAGALGLVVAPDTCVVMPAPPSAVVAGSLRGNHLVINGLVSARVDGATRVCTPVAGDDGVSVVSFDAALVRGEPGVGLDPDRLFRRVSIELSASDIKPVASPGTWEDAVCLARVALAHQLIAASRGMLDVARQHAVNRVQFGRPIASFQALRHKLAESLAAIEGAAAVANACVDGCDPLLAATAKSLAGKAARVTATHAQQVLAGIGFTTDHSFHRSLKRTLVLDTLFGSARSLPAEIGRALIESRRAPRLVEL